MKKLISTLFVIVLLSGCGSTFKMQRDNEILPNGVTVHESGFGIPEHFGKFRLEIKRRVSSDGHSDFTYLRAQRLGPERLPITALLVGVDGKVYQVSPANAIREDKGTDDKPASRRYASRQVQTFIIPPSLLDTMLSAKQNIVITIVGENIHYGANLYESKELEKLLKMLQALDSVH